VAKKRSVDINTTRGLGLALPIEVGQQVVVIGEELRALDVWSTGKAAPVRNRVWPTFSWRSTTMSERRLRLPAGCRPVRKRSSERSFPTTPSVD
jgi:hypothetical protein